MTTIIKSLDEVSQNYDALFVDLWGCLHNGLKPFDDAVQALRRFKKRGGTVLLLTNSPRPKSAVVAQLDQIGVPREIYDEIASSGDASQAGLTAGMVGKKVYHLGPERDLGFFNEIMDDVKGKVEVQRVPLEEAEGIVCTGLFDDKTETPEDYRLTIATGVNRGLKMLCTNPDIKVDYGERRIYCAGAIAEAYTKAGGTSLYFGKPHSPIYQLAYARMAGLLGYEVEEDRILCLGDGINTDIRGAVAEGLDSLFITGGLAAQEISADSAGPNPDELNKYLDAFELSPTYSIEHLR